jgi:hypothetical protein
MEQFVVNRITQKGKCVNRQLHLLKTRRGEARQTEKIEFTACQCRSGRTRSATGVLDRKGENVRSTELCVMQRTVCTSSKRIKLFNFIYQLFSFAQIIIIITLTVLYRRAHIRKVAKNKNTEGSLC